MRLSISRLAMLFLLCTSGLCAGVGAGCGGSVTSPTEEVSAEWTAGDDDALAGEGPASSDEAEAHQAEAE